MTTLRTPSIDRVDAHVERLLGPLDALRSAVLRALAVPLMGDRDARIVVFGAISVLVSLSLTALAPLWLMALGPLVLGVPHLLADARYLVARPGFHHRRWAWLVVGVPLATTWFSPKVSVGLVAVFGALVIARASLVARFAGAVLVAIAFAASLRAGRTADVVFAHLHNVVALVGFVVWLWPKDDGARPRVRSIGARLVVAALVIAASLFLLKGGADAAFVAARGYEAPRTGLDMDRLVAILSLSASPVDGLHWVLFFAFTQSMHYAIWLRLVPEGVRERPGLRPFRSTYRALTRDVGRPLVIVAALLAAALGCWAAFDMAAARDGYLRIAIFHGHLELAAFALFALEAR